MKLFKRKTTVKERLEAQIESIEAQIDECYDMETYNDLMNKYIRLLDQYNEMDKDKSHPIIDYGLKVLAIVVPAGLTIWGTKVTMDYEKEDIMTSTAGKQFFRKLF